MRRSQGIYGTLILWSKFDLKTKTPLVPAVPEFKV
jgi:hypothetical protein